MSTSTPCRSDFADALRHMNVALCSPYFVARSPSPLEKTAQRRDAKRRIAEAMDDITEVLRRPAVRFAVTSSELRTLGKHMEDLAGLLESMGVVGARSAMRRAAFRASVVETDTARFKRFRRNHDEENRMNNVERDAAASRARVDAIHAETMAALRAKASARQRPKVTPTKQRLGAKRIAAQAENQGRPGGALGLRAEYR